MAAASCFRSPEAATRGTYFWSLRAQGRKPEHCVTTYAFPDRNRTLSDDVRIAELICQRLGQRHLVLPAPKSLVKAALWNAYTSNFCSPEHFWSVNLAAHLEKHADVVFDGLAGDILSAGFLHSPKRLDAFVSGDSKRVMNSCRSDRRTRFAGYSAHRPTNGSMSIAPSRASDQWLRNTLRQTVPSHHTSFGIAHAAASR